MEKMSPVLKKFCRFWLPAIIWGILIFSVSGQSVAKVSTVYTIDFAAHKAAHVLEYAILGILIYRVIKQEKVNIREAVVYAIVISALYGFTDEFHQSFTPTRTTRLRDVFIDTIGAAVGILIVWKLLPKAPKKLLIWAKKLDLL